MHIRVFDLDFRVDKVQEKFAGCPVRNDSFAFICWRNCTHVANQLWQPTQTVQNLICSTMYNILRRAHFILVRTSMTYMYVPVRTVCAWSSWLLIMLNPLHAFLHLLTHKFGAQRFGMCVVLAYLSGCGQFHLRVRATCRTLAPNDVLVLCVGTCS